jgi:hypothetical protein
MDELGRCGGCCASEIALFHKDNRQPPPGGIARDTAPVDAAADDGDVVHSWRRFAVDGTLDHYMP